MLNNKKQIFLIGDSIRMGYCHPLREILAQKADVYFPTENCRNTQTILISLPGWAENLCQRESIDFVFFNAGHWDASRVDFEPDQALTIGPLTSIGEYEGNIEKILKRLKAVFPNAKVCFLTTTPMNDSHPAPKTRSNEDIDCYNRVALRAVKRMGVLYDDLNAFARAELKEDYYEDGCHFNEAGSRIIAEHLAKIAEKELCM